MNPRVSRSSALASKATGFPIAKVAAKLAVGFTLDELQNDITGKTLAAFEPTIDYVVTKVPRFDFEKFPSASGHLGVQMQSVGEVMAIGRTFQESLQKAYRSLEVGIDGLEAKPPTEDDPDIHRARPLDLSKLQYGTSFRLLKIREAFIEGKSLEEIYEITKIDPWFLNHIQRLSLMTDDDSIRKLKENGFSDSQIARYRNQSENSIREERIKKKILPSYKVVDTCAAEFVAQTPYCYSTYDQENEIEPLEGKKVIILGGGPNRIGQGIEFDYCCVQAVFGLKKEGYKTIMINCNPETVSTDFDLVDRLYFEPVTFEDVLNIVEFEKPDGVLIQFGGQTPLKIAMKLAQAGVPILGTSPQSIDLAEDREKFGKILDELNVECPRYGTGRTLDEVVSVAENIGYPVLARPSYVLGGRAMEIVYSRQQLVEYISRNADVTEGHPILIDEFLEDAFEFDVDALCDGESVHIGAIMQHIEEAGIHSGDSACVLPPYKISKQSLDEIKKITEQLSLKLKVKGLINIQFAYKNKKVYVLEVNPRASRTIPFVSKTTNTPLAKIAAQIAGGAKLNDFKLKDWRYYKHIAVKEAVLPFNKFPEESIFLSPEMKSTGEVMGIGKNFGEAFAKSQIATNVTIPDKGTAFISVKDEDKKYIINVAKKLLKLNFSLVATDGTQNFLNENKIKCKRVNKVREGRTHIVDMIKNNQIDLIINTTQSKQAIKDSYLIRREALNYKVCYTTTIAAANALVEAIDYSENLDVYKLQNIFKLA